MVSFVAPRTLEWINYSLERNRIYSDSLRRVDRAGGWQVIEKASLIFVKNISPKTSFSQEYYWQGERRTTNALPATLEVLQPWIIELAPDANGIPLLRIRLYGIHRTGMYYDQPYYAIWVICTNVPAGYTPQFSGDWAGRRGAIERKGNLIFEAR